MRLFVLEPEPAGFYANLLRTAHSREKADPAAFFSVVLEN
jgi:hypothetical protein